MKKPLLASAPIALLALMLAACGSKPEPAAPTPAAEPAESADAAADAAGDGADGMAAEGEMAAPEEGAAADSPPAQ